MNFSFFNRCATRESAVRQFSQGLQTAVCVLGMIFSAPLVSLSAQVADVQNSDGRIQQFLDCGEFPAAIELAKSLPADSGDQWLGRIANAQSRSGALNGAFQTASGMNSDLARTQSLYQLAAVERGYGYGDGVGTQGSGGANPRLGGQGQGGGITANDFQPLIDLIQGTVATDTWQTTGNGEGTLVPFPSGVYVDGKGVLQKIKLDQTGRMKFLKTKLDKMDSVDEKLMQNSELRKISLTELEKRAQLLIARGQPLSEAMLNLGGLTQIKYMMMYPETGEVVIAGPAGPWETDERDRVVNVESGEPVLQLDDLVVCLRNAWNDGGKFGCAIVPREGNLAATKKFLASTQLTGKSWRDGVRKTLGQQDIDVFGIEPGSHAANVLVEADYRMKLVGMGLEPTILEIPSYLDRVQLDANGNVPPMDVVRWWFTLSYENVVANKERDLFSFSGPGVKVLSETEFVNDQGKRIHTGTSVGPTKAFAEDFTKHFELMAKEYRIYSELKNVFDLAIVANLIRDQKLSRRADWNMPLFTKTPQPQFVTASGVPSMAYPLRMSDSPATVETVMNHRIIRQKVTGKTLKHTLLGVSGGVSFNAYDAMKKEKIVTENDVEFLRIKEDAKPATKASTQWWWD